MAARGDVPLQQRAGSNNAPRASPFGLESAYFGAPIRRIHSTPFTLIERKFGEKPVCLAFALPLTFGWLINRTPGAITVEVYVVDAQGRRMLSTSGPLPSGSDTPLLTTFLGVVAGWVLAEGEKMEMVITAGNIEAGNGFWWWPQKQVLNTRVTTSRMVLDASDRVVMFPDPGRSMYGSGFPFDGTFRCCYIFNYSPTTAVTATSIIETQDGDIAVDVAVPVPAATATPIMTTFGFGHGFAYPDKLRVAISAVPADGEVVFQASCLVQDMPKEF